MNNSKLNGKQRLFVYNGCQRLRHEPLSANASSLIRRIRSLADYLEGEDGRRSFSEASEEIVKLGAKIKDSLNGLAEVMLLQSSTHPVFQEMMRRSYGEALALGLYLDGEFEQCPSDWDCKDEILELSKLFPDLTFKLYVKPWNEVSLVQGECWAGQQDTVYFHKIQNGIIASSVETIQTLMLSDELIAQSLLDC